jgi:hypothetical protein
MGSAIECRQSLLALTLRNQRALESGRRDLDRLNAKAALERAMTARRDAHDPAAARIRGRDTTRPARPAVPTLGCEVFVTMAALTQSKDVML